MRHSPQPHLKLDMDGRAEVYQARNRNHKAVNRSGEQGEFVMRECASVMASWCVLLLLGVGLVSTTPVLGANPDPVAAADLRHIKKFVAVEVQTQGTAEKLGIRAADLTDVARVTLLNKVPGIALEGSSGPSPDASERPNQLGFFTCEVWTVGEQYIAAYHVDCNAGSYTAQKTPGSLWNQAILGYGPKDEVSDAVRKGVRAMVELFATTFAGVRADGSGR